MAKKQEETPLNSLIVTIPSIFDEVINCLLLVIELHNVIFNRFVRADKCQIDKILFPKTQSLPMSIDTNNEIIIAGDIVFKGGFHCDEILRI